MNVRGSGRGLLFQADRLQTSDYQMNVRGGSSSVLPSLHHGGGSNKTPSFLLPHGNDQEPLPARSPGR